MNWLDVTGGEKCLINLDLVRRIAMKDFGREAEITFVYADGTEDIFKVSSGRLSVLSDVLFEVKVA